MTHYGQWGVLTSIGGKLQCHLCGRAYDFLGCHVWRTHEMSPDEYREMFGLPRTFGLVSDRLHCAMRQHVNQLVADGAKGFRASSRRDAGTIAADQCQECGGSIMRRHRIGDRRLLCARPACVASARARHARAVNSARTPEHQQRLNASLVAWNAAHRIEHHPVTCRNPQCGKEFLYVRRKRYCSITCAAQHRATNPAWRAAVSRTWLNQKPAANG